MAAPIVGECFSGVRIETGGRASDLIDEMGVAQMTFCHFCYKCFEGWFLYIYLNRYRATQRDSFGRYGVCRGMTWGTIMESRRHRGLGVSARRIGLTLRRE